MAGDFLGRIQVLRHQGRGHHQRVAHVHEPLAGSGIGRKFPDRVQRIQARQIADRKRVFGVVQPAQHHRPRIARPRPGHFIQQGVDAFHQLLPFLRGGLRFALGRHLAIRDLLQRLQPRFRLFEYLGGQGELLQIEIALVLFRGMALEAISGYQRFDRFCEHPAPDGVAGCLIRSRGRVARRYEKADCDCPARHFQPGIQDLESSR